MGARFAEVLGAETAYLWAPVQCLGTGLGTRQVGAGKSAFSGSETSKRRAPEGILTKYA